MCRQSSIPTSILTGREVGVGTGVDIKVDGSTAEEGFPSTADCKTSKPYLYR